MQRENRPTKVTEKTTFSGANTLVVKSTVRRVRSAPHFLSLGNGQVVVRLDNLDASFA